MREKSAGQSFVGKNKRERAKIKIVVDTHNYRLYVIEVKRTNGAKAGGKVELPGRKVGGGTKRPGPGD